MAEEMQKRLYHRPRFHVAGHGEGRKVGWLELFYDLIYVAAIIQLGNALSENVGWLGFLAFFGLMTPLWYTWTGFTFYMNRFVIDDFLHRCTVFVQMLFIGSVAVFVPDVFDGNIQGFAIAYGGARLVLAGMYARTWWQTEQARDFTSRYALGFGLGASVWLLSAFVATPWAFLLWILAMGIDLWVPLSKHAREVLARYPPDSTHMAERYGLLTIIVLGESFVKVLTAVSETGMTPQIAAMAAMALGITCFMWWLYFDDVAGSRIKPSLLSALIWIYGHLPLTVSIVAVGVAIKKAIFFDPFEVATAKYRWLLCGTLGLALLSTALLDMVTERRQSEVRDQLRVNIRLGSALVVVLLAAIGGLPGSVFVAIVTCVCFLQVIIDLLTSPLAADPHSIHHGALRFAAPGVEAVPEAEDAPAPRRDIGDAVRKGTPSELRRDLYFHFLDGSWTQLFFALIVIYLLSNGVFAGLYLLLDGSVSNIPADDFVSAFAFSVQTMSTIGYGVMAPQSGWGHLLVTVEAAFGLLGVALATGLFFAKMARPSTGVLFSKPVVVTTHHGKPTLMFRVGNARGNEIVEASIRVSVLTDEISPEGNRLRRIQDLKLVRDTSPIFSLSWTVMHVIDETSPIYGMTPENLADRVYSLIVTMTGYDATYAQTTHARQMYRPEAIEFDAQFVDVISTLPDGRMLVDYDVFHDTVPADAQT